MKHAIWSLLLSVIVMLACMGTVASDSFNESKTPLVSVQRTLSVADHELNPTSEFSSVDLHRVNRTIELIVDNEWNEALSESQGVSKPWFRTLIQWMYLQNPAHPHSLYDYTDFLHKYPHWVNQDTMLKDAERKIGFYYMTKDHVINFFNNYAPVTGFGSMRLGEAYLRNGDRDLAYKYLKDGFINGKFNADELKDIHTTYESVLTKQDFIARANRLAWDRDHQELQQILPYLPADQRLLFSARHKLMTHTYGVDYAISIVPEDLTADIGLRYNRALWRWERNRYAASADLMFIHSLDDIPAEFHDHWMRLSLKHSRHFITTKNTQRALEFLHLSNHLTAAVKTNVLWYSGWLQLSFMQQPKIAQQKFTQMYDHAESARDTSRAAFWNAKALERLGEYTQSFNWYKKAAAYPTTFYGQLGANHLVGTQLVFADSSDFNQQDYVAFKRSDPVKAILFLREKNFKILSKKLLYTLGTQHSDVTIRSYAAALAQQLGESQLSIRIAKFNLRQGHLYVNTCYPKITIPRLGRHASAIADAVVLAIIRQESEFVFDATSRVGAQGLMQIMPATRQSIINELKFSPNALSQLDRVNANIALGAYYISYLNEKYNRSLPLALAAYNAGPSRVNEWIKRYGDPREGDISMIDFVEQIPFTETRHYVKKVMESLQVYQLTMHR